MVLTPRSRLFLGAVIVLFVVALAPRGLKADHALGYHWPNATAGPVVLTLGDNVSPFWDSHLSGAVSDWDQSAVLDLTIVPGAASRSCKPAKGKIEVCSAAYGLTGWLGLAKLWASGNHLTQASAQVNDTYFVQFGAAFGYDTPEWRQYVMCQEIGHDFGLDHNDEVFDNFNKGTCMDYTDVPEGGSGFGPANTSPNAHDYDELESIYNHVDTSDGGGGGGRGRFGGPPVFRFDPGPQDPFQGVDPADLGELIRSNGRLQLFRLDLGGGNVILTFVIRA